MIRIGSYAVVAHLMYYRSSLRNWGKSRTDLSAWSPRSVKNRTEWPVEFAAGVVNLLWLSFLRSSSSKSKSRKLIINLFCVKELEKASTSLHGASTQNIIIIIINILTVVKKSDFTTSEDVVPSHIEEDPDEEALGLPLLADSHASCSVCRAQVYLRCTDGVVYKQPHKNRN